MLSRLAARVIRPWTHAYCRRAFSDTVVKSMVAADRDERPPEFTALGKTVAKRLKTVRSSLNAGYQEPPPLDDLSKWRHTVEVQDIDEAILNGGEDLLEAPCWVLLYLLSTKVHSPSQAMTAVSLMLQYFPKADASIQPSLFILTARFLAKQQTTLPMSNLVKAFLMLNLQKPTTQFNLLLRSMSHFRPTPELAKVTTQILDAMRARQLSLHSRTYRSLLSNELVTLELAKKLQHRMERDGFVPNASHLEAYLRVFAKHGAVHASARYLNLIRKRRLKEGKIAPHGVQLSSSGAVAQVSTESVNTRWNTEFLSSFGRHTGSAFHYLRDLVSEEEESTPLPRPVRKESRVPLATGKIAPVIWKKGLHVSDWTVLLNIAARDPKTSSARLLGIFDQVRATARIPLTVGVFTAVMRGLVKKGDYDAASQVWERCCKLWHRRRTVDTKALTVAMDVLVGSGQALTAFDTLIETVGILHSETTLAPQGRVPPRLMAKRKFHSRAAKIDTALVNALMDAFLKHGRPDVVFKLWDAFTPLFGVAPNAESLTVILKAAHEAARFDHTFRGLLEQMGLHSLFQTKKAWPDYKTKSKPQIVQSLRRIIDRGSGRARDGDGNAREETFVRKSLWNSELVAPKVFALFREIVLGNFPHLHAVEPPATAIWPDDAQEGHPMRNAFRSLGLGLRGERKAETEPGGGKEGMESGTATRAPFLVGPAYAMRRALFTPAGSSTHPQIVPNERTFAAYITLLGSQRRGSEVALTLAWMRALGVIPTKRPLALALALWSEVSVRGPLLERYGGVGEYEKLHRWLVEWLGWERMPTDSAMAWTYKYLQKEREK